MDKLEKKELNKEIKYQTHKDLSFIFMVLGLVFSIFALGLIPATISLILSIINYKKHNDKNMLNIRLNILSIIISIAILTIIIFMLINMNEFI